MKRPIDPDTWRPPTGRSRDAGARRVPGALGGSLLFDRPEHAAFREQLSAFVAELNRNACVLRREVAERGNAAVNAVLRIESHLRVDFVALVRVAGSAAENVFPEGDCRVHFYFNVRRVHRFESARVDFNRKAVADVHGQTVAYGLVAPD